MTLSTFLQPDNATQSGSAYKGAIDSAAAVSARLAAAFAPHQQTVADLTVAVDAGVIPTIAGIPTEVAATSTASLTAPTVNPRQDIIYIDAVSAAVGVATGAEAASPVDPAVPAGKIAIARINWTVAMAEITNADLDDLRYLTLTGLAAALASTGLKQSSGKLEVDIPGLTSDSGPAVGSEIALNMAGALRRMTLQDMLKVINALTEDGSPVSGDFLISYDTSASAAKKVDVANLTGGKVLQVAQARLTTFASGTTTIPEKDTLPQNTEGTEFLTMAFTPLSATSTLYITFTTGLSSSNSTTQKATAALFVDTTADALCAIKGGTAGGVERDSVLTLVFNVAAASVTARTYKIRMGMSQAGTIYVGGNDANTDFGGNLAAGMTIMEVEA